MRWWVCFGLLVIGLLLPTEALACSGPLPTLEDYAIQAEVIAIGTIVDLNEDTFTLQVEEYLKGDAEDTTLEVNNHSISVSGDGRCEMTLGPGNRYSASARLLLFLHADRFEVAEWQVGDPFMGGSYYVDNDSITVVDPVAQIIPLAVVRERIRAVAEGEQPGSVPVATQILVPPPPVDLPLLPTPENPADLARTVVAPPSLPPTPTSADAPVAPPPPLPEPTATPVAIGQMPGAMPLPGMIEPGMLEPTIPVDQAAAGTNARSSQLPWSIAGVLVVLGVIAVAGMLYRRRADRLE